MDSAKNNGFIGRGHYQLSPPHPPTPLLQETKKNTQEAQTE